VLALGAENTATANLQGDRVGEPPAAKTHDVGAIFAKGYKPYFPMLLGNGSIAC